MDRAIMPSKPFELELLEPLDPPLSVPFESARTMLGPIRPWPRCGLTSERKLGAFYDKLSGVQKCVQSSYHQNVDQNDHLRVGSFLFQPMWFHPWFHFTPSQVFFRLAALF